MPAILPLLLALIASGCMFEHMDRDRASRPEKAMGAGAVIMYPGQSGPGMGPSGSAQSSGSSSSGPDVTLLGGSSAETSSSQKSRQTPLIGPLTALLGYPFWIFGKSLDQKAEQAAQERENAGEHGTKPRGDGAERERLRLENERMEQELKRRAGAAEAAQRRPGSSGSLAEELAALEGRDGGYAALPKAGGATRARRETPRETVDRNGDGTPDLWAYYEGLRLKREVLDENHDGRPDRVLHYDANRRLTRSEEDSDGDGELETVSIYRDGELARKRADSSGDGQADSWSFYHGGELVRHELDRDGDGFRDLVMTYAGGELTREEEDRNGDGRSDSVAHYRGGELTERHEDIDFDGKPDVASYYENGRLARRELHSEESLRSWQDSDSP